MKFIADLHIHSKYSRATSRNMVLEEIGRWANDKGIQVMATGDFTHPFWMAEIKEKLEPAEPGLFKLKEEYKQKTLKGTFDETRFILNVEISGIYSRKGKTHRIHNIVFAPSIETAEKINNVLSSVGNLNSDGRPILGLDAEDLARIVFETDERAVIIPAHAWTPWFSLFGSMSGFDSIEECFGKYAEKIFAIETGLSSDPVMNWQWSHLDRVALISNSDSHSLQKIGREANIFDTEMSYDGIMSAIKDGIPDLHKDGTRPQKFVATLEFFPEEGKYHYDGHRACNVVWAPEETEKHNGLCKVCGKPVTVGVMNRVEKMADRKIEAERKNNFVSHKGRVPFYNLVQLDEIIGDAFGMGLTSKKVKAEYENILREFGSEIKVLMDVSVDDIKNKADARVAEGIRRMREGKLTIRPGYDGEYGIIKIFNEDEGRGVKPASSLF